MRAKRIVVIVFIVVAVLILLCYGLFQISKSRTFQFFGDITHRVATNQKVVALTFDDAPTKYSDDVVKILEERDIKATFYVIGKYLEQYPTEAKNIVRHGHELGNHSYSHERFLFQSLPYVSSEIERTNDLIRTAGYKEEITFRPPYGKKLFTLPWYLKEHDMKTITWDIEPDTYVSDGLNPEDKKKFLANYTIKNTKPGSIILLHPFCEGCESERKALAQIIDALRADGYTFVTISELLKQSQ